MAVIAAYRRVLRNPALARLLFGEFVSSVGDWLYLVALLVVVYAEQNDAVALGVIGAARVLPYVLLSVPAGIAADRYDRRMILIVTDVARGVIMLGIAAAVWLNAGVFVIVGLAVLATCFSAFFSPAIGAYLPTLVRDESELGPANSAWASLDNLAFFVGPAVAALLLNVGGLVIAFLINALTFAIVAGVLWRLPRAGRGLSGGEPASGDVERGVEAEAQPTDLRTALAPVLRPLSALVAISLVGGFVFGGLGVMTVILAVDVYNAGEGGTGLLNSAIGVGGVLGALTAGVLVLRRRLGPPLIGGSLAIGGGVSLLGIVPDFGLALFAIGVAAAGAMLVDVVSTTLFQRVVPDAVRGRTLGVMETMYVLAYAAGSFVMPVLGAIDPGPILIVSGMAMAGSGVLALVLLGKYGIQEAPDDARGRLAGVPLFAGLPPSSLERAMAAARIEAMRAGQVIIRQGDKADRFYLIVEGEVEVTQSDTGGPPRVLRRMGAGEVFGEIGLLSGVPRTASVTAVTGGALVALDKSPFLRLVGAGPGLTYRLLDLHRGASTAG